MSRKKTNLLSLVKNSVKDWELYKKYKKELPVRPKNDDLYLIAFPKSGLTWLSFLMSSIHLKMSNKEAKVTFFNIHNYIPDIHDSNFLNEVPLDFPGFRVIKSHAEYNPFYTRIVYLIRDPRDVMVSYYFYLQSQGRYDKTISEFVRDRRFGINKWIQHLDSWLNKPTSSLRAYFIRYEDLKTKPSETLDSFYEMMGYKVPEKILHEAIGECSFDKMKENEELFRKINPVYDKSFRGSFVRKGKRNNYLNMLNESDIDYISQLTEKYLKLFNYMDS